MEFRAAAWFLSVPFRTSGERWNVFGQPVTRCIPYPKQKNKLCLPPKSLELFVRIELHLLRDVAKKHNLFLVCSPVDHCNIAKELD